MDIGCSCCGLAASSRVPAKRYRGLLRQVFAEPGAEPGPSRAAPRVPPARLRAIGTLVEYAGANPDRLAKIGAGLHGRAAAALRTGKVGHLILAVECFSRMLDGGVTCALIAGDCVAVASKLWQCVDLFLQLLGLRLWIKTMQHSKGEAQCMARVNRFIPEICRMAEFIIDEEEQEGTFTLPDPEGARRVPDWRYARSAALQFLEELITLSRDFPLAPKRLKLLLETFRKNRNIPDPTPHGRSLSPSAIADACFGRVIELCDNSVDVCCITPLLFRSLVSERAPLKTNRAYVDRFRETVIRNGVQFAAFTSLLQLLRDEDVPYVHLSGVTDCAAHVGRSIADESDAALLLAMCLQKLPFALAGVGSLERVDFQVLVRGFAARLDAGQALAAVFTALENFDREATASILARAVLLELLDPLADRLEAPLPRNGVPRQIKAKLAALDNHDSTHEPALRLVQKLEAAYGGQIPAAPSAAPSIFVVSSSQLEQLSSPVRGLPGLPLTGAPRVATLGDAEVLSESYGKLLSTSKRTCNEGWKGVGAVLEDLKESGARENSLDQIRLDISGTNGVSP